MIILANGLAMTCSEAANEVSKAIGWMDLPFVRQVPATFNGEMSQRPLRGK
jgi:hypothetical protein